MSKRKIAIVYPKPVIGGSTTSLLGLLDSLNKNENSITLYFFDFSGPLSGAFRSIQNIKIVNLNSENRVRIMKRINPLVWVIKIFAKIISFFARKKNVDGQIMSYCNNWFRKKVNNEVYDIAIAFLESDTSIFVSQKIKARKKISWMHVHYSKAGFMSVFDRKMYKAFDKIVTVSEECRNAFVSSFNAIEDKVVYIPNILSEKYVRTMMKCDISDQLPPHQLNVVTTCRIDINHKGLDRAIRAIADIQKNNAINFRWFIIGDGPDYSLLSKMIIANNLSNNVNLLGNRINPFPYYLNANLFFLPSRYEGRPMAVDEALLAGLPCVVTDYSSSKEQIINGVNGLIIDNNYKAIYNFLLRLNNHEIDFKKLEKRAKSTKYFNDEAIRKVGELLND